LPGLESDTHQSLFAKVKMMGLAKGSTHPTGYSTVSLRRRFQGFVEATMGEV
jgi:hypothetical protein